ncbi:hypothetical protein G9C98_007307 [Cotesia typhae]|uniref:Uncharacterized protein n=1 Tax=Cotesia typhae TaxID=2053667 RepID=A0A8J5RAK0_9HYME|nr:hypothetical protein G9C98_007307 [Cotesia typhae]
MKYFNDVTVLNVHVVTVLLREFYDVVLRVLFHFHQLLCLLEFRIPQILTYPANVLRDRIVST